MRAALLEENNKPLAVVDDVEVEEPRFGEVVVKVSNCGICHSDLTMVDAPGGAQLPIVLGHEAAGVVAAVGDGVRHVAVGDPVVVSLIRSCGACHGCAAGMPVNCSGRFTIDATRPLPEIVEALNDFQPTALLGYASMVSLLAGEQIEGRLSIAPKKIATFSELLSPIVHDNILQRYSTTGVYRQSL